MHGHQDVKLNCLVFLITTSVIFDPGLYNLGEAEFSNG